ncbi:hypothetical protein HK096_006365, partial [Nowakowskiella sp. JEL0078]
MENDSLGDIKQIDIFISYSWKNSSSASSGNSTVGKTDPRKIAQFLERNGFKVWLDDQQLTGGSPLYSRIFDALQQCKLVIACVSSEYVQSDICRCELQYARTRLRRQIIPVVVGENNFDWLNTVVGFLLVEYIFIDCTQQIRFEDILVAVKNIIDLKQNQSDFVTILTTLNQSNPSNAVAEQKQKNNGGGILCGFCVPSSVEEDKLFPGEEDKVMGNRTRKQIGLGKCIIIIALISVIIIAAIVIVVLLLTGLSPAASNSQPSLTASTSQSSIPATSISQSLVTTSISQSLATTSRILPTIISNSDSLAGFIFCLRRKRKSDVQFDAVPFAPEFQSHISTPNDPTLNYGYTTVPMYQDVSLENQVEIQEDLILVDEEQSVATFSATDLQRHQVQQSVKLSADSGDRESQYALASMYELKNENSLAFEYYLKSATQGYSSAQYKVGWFYLNGLDKSNNGFEGILESERIQNVVVWWEKAAQGEIRDLGAAQGLVEIFLGKTDKDPKKYGVNEEKGL